MRSLQAIILDFDGVIADTEPLHLRAFQEVLAEEGVKLTAVEYAERYLGRSDAAVFESVALSRGSALDALRLRSLLARKASRYDALIAASDVMIAGAADRVRAWSKVLPLAIASGARRVEVESVLGSAGLLDHFSAIVSAEDVRRGKPAPDPYVLALDRLTAAGRGSAPGELAEGLHPANVVGIEDSLSGLQAIRAAGMHAVAVTTSCPASRLAGAELVVSSIVDLDLEMLDRLVGRARG